MQLENKKKNAKIEMKRSFGRQCCFFFLEMFYGRRQWQDHCTSLQLCWDSVFDDKQTATTAFQRRSMAAQLARTKTPSKEDFHLSKLC